jgi:hypothetical protein
MARLKRLVILWEEAEGQTYIHKGVHMMDSITNGDAHDSLLRAMHVKLMGSGVKSDKTGSPAHAYRDEDRENVFDARVKTAHGNGNVAKGEKNLNSAAERRRLGEDRDEFDQQPEAGLYSVHRRDEEAQYVPADEDMRMHDDDLYRADSSVCARVYVFWVCRVYGSCSEIIDVVNQRYGVFQNTAQSALYSHHHEYDAALHFFAICWYPRTPSQVSSHPSLRFRLWKAM